MEPGQDHQNLLLKPSQDASTPLGLCPGRGLQVGERVRLGWEPQCPRLAWMIRISDWGVFSWILRLYYFMMVMMFCISKPFTIFPDKPRRLFFLPRAFVTLML